MWVFYMISLPWTVGMVIFTLIYFANSYVPRYVFFTVGYAWFCSLSIIVLVPADIWTTIVGHHNGLISFFWSWSYWGTFLLSWFVVPVLQGYEDADDFTVTERLKTSVRANLLFYLIVGSTALFGLIFLISIGSWSGSWLGFAMGCSNTFGLVTGAFLLGFSLSEIPRSLWKNADWDFRQKRLSHKIAAMAVKFDDAHQNFSNAIVVTQATSNQMSKRDHLRPHMDVIDKMLVQMLKKDPTFKPQGGKLGDADMEYDIDEKSMATLQRQLRVSSEEYYRYKSEYLTYVTEALELEDTIRSYELREAIGWRYTSTLRGSRFGSVGNLLDTTELIWRCILRKQLQRLLAIILGFMSLAILVGEATLLPSVDLSLFSLLINSVGEHEILVQACAFVPLMYMCVCTYYSLFKIQMVTSCSLTPRQTSSVNLLMICSMIARYAAPISYNFLNLIRLDNGSKTIFEKRMGTIDDAVPFFGRIFNRLYPLIMVVYTLMVASDYFDRMLEYFGSWKIFRFLNHTDNMDGFEPSGVIILQKERRWLEQGAKVGEHVIPLARNFSGISVDDVESNANKEVVSNKYEAMREQIHQTGSLESRGNHISKVLLHGEGDSSQSRIPIEITSSSSSAPTKWESMKTGFQNMKESIGVQDFLPVRQVEEIRLLSQTSSLSESLDEIFHKLKRPVAIDTTYDNNEEGIDDI